ncbi:MULTISPECIES: methyltransferase domain-containing protein [Fusobacterium]|uniref:methyltransferase domain-containing protein n=1 Tax=Fusobacterium TaxID=848 RepID=UPI001476A34A|nr:MULTISPECIES: methyltransferase domain-containing protein [Fusobacterium]NME34988.1 methyltransferase domain-containing protein [Fusobacterium sp. FSA-380-WT-3A]
MIEIIKETVYYKIIKKIRKEQKLTQTELAKKSGVSFKTINRYENGRKISFDSEKKIFDALGINIEKVETSLEKNKSSFNKQAEDYNKFEFINNKTEIQKIINSGYPYNNKRVLDLACGVGVIALELSKYAEIVDALDISPLMIEKIKKACNKKGISNINYLVGDAHNLKYEDNTFDTIVTRLSMHHFNNPVVVLKEIKRVLKNFGELIIIDIIANENEEEAKLQDSFNKIRDFSHNKFFTLNSLKKMLKDESFINPEIQLWKQKRNFKDWISLSNYSDDENILYNIMKGFAINNIKLGMNLSFENNNLSFEQKMLLIKIINIK